MRAHTPKWTDRTPCSIYPADGQDTLLVSCPVRPLRPAEKTDNGAFGAFVRTAKMHSSGPKNSAGKLFLGISGRSVDQIEFSISRRRSAKNTFLDYSRKVELRCYSVIWGLMIGCRTTAHSGRSRRLGVIGTNHPWRTKTLMESIALSRFRSGCGA